MRIVHPRHRTLLDTEQEALVEFEGHHAVIRAQQTDAEDVGGAGGRLICFAPPLLRVAAS